MTIGANCLGLVVFVPLLSRQFVRRRGMAISIVQSANGFGRAASAPLVQLLISTSAGGRRFWRKPRSLPLRCRCWRRYSAGRPATRSRRNRARQRSPLPPSRPSPGWTLAEALRTPHFWLLFAVYLFTGVGSFLVSLHQLAFAIDVGFDKLYAAGVLGIGSFLAIGGTIVTGTLSDYIGREWSAILAYGVSIVGVVCAF